MSKRKTIVDSDNWFQKLVGQIKCFFGVHTIVTNGSVPVKYATCKYCPKTFKYDFDDENIAK